MVRYYRSLQVAWRLLRTYVVTYARNCPALIPPRVMGENRSGLRGVGPKPVVNGSELVFRLETDIANGDVLAPEILTDNGLAMDAPWNRTG